MLKSEANGFHLIMASALRGETKCHIVLLNKTRGGMDKSLKPGDKWRAYKPSAKDPTHLAKVLLKSPDVIYTMCLDRSPSTQKVTAMEAIQPFLPLDDIAFRARLIDLKEKKSLGESVTAEEEFVLKHSRDMEKLKELLVKKDRMRTTLKDVDSALRYPWDFVLNDETVRVFNIDPHTLKCNVAKDPADAILDAVGMYTVVFFGAPGKGKTPVARALAALYSRSNGKGKFVETQTADSLRKLSEFDLLEDGIGILLDEWRPRTEHCGPQGGGIDHMKNMLDPSDAKTIEARFADFTLPDSTAKFVTVQNLGKLLPIFTELTADATEQDLRASVGNDDDAKAILERCMFVEVRDQLVEPRLRAAHQDENRNSKGKMLWEAANLLRQEGDTNKLRSIPPGMWNRLYRATS